METSHLALFVVSAALASPLCSQQAWATVFGPLVGGNTGAQVAAAGDMDGDSVPDFLVSSAGVHRVDIVSGANFTVRSISVVGTPTAIASSIDMNLDGVRDVVVARAGGVAAFSGATTNQLWAVSFSVVAAAPIGDIDGDGRGDVAIVTSTSPPYIETLRTIRGSNGTQIAQSNFPVNTITTALISLDDVTGDGLAEIARGTGSGVQVIQAINFATVVNHTGIGGWRLAAADMVGDARKEILAHNLSGLSVISPTTGAILRQFTGGGSQGDFAVVGDLNSDGVPDLAMVGGPGIEFVSGAVGYPGRDVLSTWPSTTSFPCQRLAGVGDVTGDGIGDLLMGSPSASPTPPPLSLTGGWQLLSGRILATMSFPPTSCGQGPFLPELGITRPILGLTATVAGRDVPYGTTGFLLFSPQPTTSWSLGVPGCDVWLQYGNAVVVHQPLGLTWQYSFGIPAIPQLAGLPFAMQALYAPTVSPVGFDLSNGVWARIGY